MRDRPEASHWHSGVCLSTLQTDPKSVLLSDSLKCRRCVGQTSEDDNDLTEHLTDGARGEADQ